MNAKQITKVVKNLKPGDTIEVERQVNGRAYRFIYIVEKVEALSTGYTLICRDWFEGYKPRRNFYRDINPYTTPPISAIEVIKM